MRISGDQFRLPLASIVGSAASSAAQSATRLGLLSGLGMATPLEHWAVNWGAMGMSMGMGAPQIGSPIRSISLSPKGARRDSEMQPVSRLPWRRKS